MTGLRGKYPEALEKMSAEPMYLDNIREFLDDGDGIVTYRWLSHTLSVPCNVAKQMLYSYWEQNRAAGDLHVVYLISGLYQREGKAGNSHMMVVTLADEGEVDAVKSKLAKISTVHVYSLQKAPLRDRSLLHSVDDKLTEQQLLEYPKWSSIKCTAVKRPPPNMEGTSLSVKPSENVQFSAKKPPKLSFMESKVASVLPREGSSAEREDRDSSASKKTLSGGSRGSKTKGKSGVAAMFNRMTDAERKGKPALHVKEEKRKEEEEEGSVVASKGKRSPKKQHLNKVSAKELPGATSVEPLDTQERTNGDSGKAGNKRTAQETSKDAKNAQKRRRVLVFSSDSEGEQHEEEEKPCKEDQNTVHSKTETKMEMPVSMTTSTTVKKQRKRVRRLKSRMFEDSDGSMVTEKYYESDSTDASGDDEAPPPPPSSTNQLTAVTEQPAISTCSEEKGSRKAAKKGHTSTSTKQQKSLTSFFTKQ